MLMCVSMAQSIFQLTHSRGVRQRVPNYCFASSYFNSRTHVECDVATSRKVPDFEISTHALTWSATETFLVLPKMILFQLTHSRGVRPQYGLMRPMPIEISTHALTWSATKKINICNKNSRISTHALTWSATAAVARRNVPMQFQLTHSRGVRPIVGWDFLFTHPFQLAHSRGVRLPPLSGTVP